ncbi:MAG: hypothetical protein ACI8P3_003406 [Saprospiraceae bacterium]|jgi:hypothetical protein
MKTKSKKSLDSFQTFGLKRDQLKHLKGGGDIIIEDLVDG